MAASSSSEINAVDLAGSEPSEAVRNALMQLKSPKASDLARSRVVSSNKTKQYSGRGDGVRGQRGPGNMPAKKSGKMKTNFVETRIREFKDEPFRNSNNKLFCDACREEISEKASIIKCHVESKKHKSGVERLAKKKKKDITVLDAMKKYDQEVHPKGEMLSDSKRLFRIKVMKTFLKAGVPLKKMDDFRELLEEGGYRLTSVPNMRQLIPFVRKEEEETIKGEISGSNVSVIFDGTTRLGEALAIVVRFITADWEIKQRLVRLQLLAKSLKGDELAREIIMVLAQQYNVQNNSLCASMRDGASVNRAAMRTVKIVFPKVVDVRCFSHAIDGVGSHFNIPTVKRFLQLWNALFSHSPATRLAWRERTGISKKSYSPTRWWSWWEVAQQVMLQFAEIQPFVQERLQTAVNKATLRQIEEMFDDDQTKLLLQIELAVVVDAGKPMVQSTYILEGDGTLAWQCYEQLLVIQNSIQVANLPNLEALSRHVSGGNAVFAQQCYQYGVAAIQPGWEYFTQTVMGVMGPQVLIFKAARLFSPHQVCQLRPVANDVDIVTSIAFLNDPALIANLKNELPRYLAKADGIDDDVDPLGWWKANEAELPFWSAAAKLVLLMQPSSASSERVFSILTTTFGHLQDLALQDYIECSLMLQFNKR
ncbi:hypothetical protein QZH41_007565 [Actinostola sp. cb2023]|nr:hypothetical protein QZH41_007565 [Actinostola sp. cb2023]